MSRLRDRFDDPKSDAMERFSSSLDVDLEMLDEDIAASKAHARMLGSVGVLEASEAERLVEGLEAVRREITDGEWSPSAEHEDVHMAVEARLVGHVGDLGRKLHTARSRNDQVATDVRLWMKGRLGDLDLVLVALIEQLVERVESDGAFVMPGYTHLQRGQPILLGHHLLAHIWPLLRDRERLAQACRRLDASPLGACAMAGTSHPIDRDMTARDLGFSGVVENAMDAVAARDHLQEVAADCAIVITHLSRLAEELVIWSSEEFDFVRLGDAHATGSSIMPQKRNPDAAELIRGKTGRVYGGLVQLLTLVKGLPLSYNRDLQEDRSALFDVVRTTEDSVGLMAEVVGAMEFRADRFAAELATDWSLATELADALTEGGVPFRTAHEAVGRLVRELEGAGRSFADLTEEELESFHPGLGSLLDRLDVDAAIRRRTSRGGTAPAEIGRQVELVRSALATA